MMSYELRFNCVPGLSATMKLMLRRTLVLQQFY